MTEIYGQKNVLLNFQDTETSFKQILTDFLTFMNITFGSICRTFVFIHLLRNAKSYKVPMIDDQFGWKNNQILGLSNEIFESFFPKSNGEEN